MSLLEQIERLRAFYEMQTGKRPYNLHIPKHLCEKLVEEITPQLYTPGPVYLSELLGLNVHQVSDGELYVS